MISRKLSSDVDSWLLHRSRIVDTFKESVKTVEASKSKPGTPAGRL
jgi:hypothetical protein